MHLYLINICNYNPLEILGNPFNHRANEVCGIRECFRMSFTVEYLPKQFNYRRQAVMFFVICGKKSLKIEGGCKLESFLRLKERRH